MPWDARKRGCCLDRIAGRPVDDPRFTLVVFQKFQELLFEPRTLGSTW